MEDPYDGRTYVSIDEFDKFRITYRNHRYSGGIEYTAKLPLDLNLESRIGYENLDLMQTVEISRDSAVPVGLPEPGPAVRVGIQPAVVLTVRSP